MFPLLVGASVSDSFLFRCGRLCSLLSVLETSDLNLCWFWMGCHSHCEFICSYLVCYVWKTLLTRTHSWPLGIFLSALLHRFLSCVRRHPWCPDEDITLMTEDLKISYSFHFVFCKKKFLWCRLSKSQILDICFSVWEGTAKATNGQL